MGCAYSKGTTTSVADDSRVVRNVRVACDDILGEDSRSYSDTTSEWMVRVG